MGVKIIVIITTLQVVSLFPYGSSLPAGTSSTDPCEHSPCGSGAECKAMGSIAICVCPNDGKGDPFVACMKQDSANLSESSLSQTDSTKILFDKPVHDKEVISPVIVIPSTHSSLSASSKNLPEIAASFNVGAVHQPFSDINVSSPVDYPPSSTPTSDKSDSPQHRFDMSSTTTTTPSSFPKTSNSRPATISISNPNNHPNFPESHRIPIIPQESQNPNKYYKHDYTPRPMTSTVGYSNTNGGHTSGFGSLHEKTYYPFPDFVVKTSPYPDNHRRDPISSHSHPTYATYEWSNAPPAFPTRSTVPYGHHGYHPNSYGFPEKSPPDTSYNSVMSGSSYNYNHLRNDISSSRGDDRESMSRIPDPLGIYDRCRRVNGIVVCADKDIPVGGSTYGHQPISHSNSYGTSTYRDQERDRYDEFSRMPISDIFQATSLRPTATYSHNYDNHHSYPDRYQSNYGYHRHNPNDRMDTKFGYEAFPVEVPRATEVFIGDQSSSATITQSSNNDQCKSACGVGAICRVVLTRPVCGCPEKHTGDPSVRCEPIQEESRGRSDSAGTCQRHYDCDKTQVCANNECQDPCQNEHNIAPSTNSRQSSLQRETLSLAGDDQFNYKASICGSNAQCLVVEHVPVCKCLQNYSGNPYVACVQ